MKRKRKGEAFECTEDITIFHKYLTAADAAFAAVYLDMMKMKHKGRSKTRIERSF